MSASPSLPPPAKKIKLKRKRENNLGLHRGASEEDEAQLANMQDGDGSPVTNSDFWTDPPPEVFPNKGIRISDFPAAVKQKVGRPHSSVFTLVAAEQAVFSSDPVDERSRVHSFFLENISHGQLQVLSRIPADCPALVPLDQEKPESSSFLCTPPSIAEGRGALRWFKVPDQAGALVHILPTHADWFSSTKIHRLERQVVPRYFTGKSNDCTPEKYMDIRNKIVTKYLECPEKMLTISDCQGLADVNIQELSRIVRFLDQWGIINYRAASTHRSNYSGSGVVPTIQEDYNGELHLPSAYLRSIDSLIYFDKPRSRLREEDVSSLSVGSVEVMPDLDKRIRERLTENRCHHCAQPCSCIYYQSQKEAEAILCSDCFHDGKFIVGNSSIDFLKVDAVKDSNDLDSDTWTDHETLLLLEALEIHNDNWNEIAEHVGTKSKAQCILQFVRLPMEDCFLESIEFPTSVFSSDIAKEGSRTKFPMANGDSLACHHEEVDSEGRLPFANSGNPLMSVVSFLATAMGPRVAAACAHSALALLSRVGSNSISAGNLSQLEGASQGDRGNSENMHQDGMQGSLGHHKEESQTETKESVERLSPEIVKAAARAGLSAAAMKAKLFADHEERDIQRMSATIINHQLKRIELKLKQIGEIETLLLKECDQVERARQRIAADRARLLSSRFAGPVSSPLPTVGAAAAVTTSNRPVMPASAPQPTVPAFNQQVNHPAMSFMPRQPMFAFGPRVPLSALHPPPPVPTGPVMVNSPSPNPSVSHSMLRPVSGTNTNVN
ncbi:SWI/SNF complex subunit SWI3C [Nymphaea colorata]|nr:SWI/SNF complex subunit SWI3C [Nymphaea colorata]